MITNRVLGIFHSGTMPRCALVAVLALAAGACVAPLPPDTNAGAVVAAPEVNVQAPDFSLTTLDGRTLSLSNFRGQTVLLNFWATWCIPCQAEMPDIQAAYQAYRDRDFVVLSVNVKEDEAAVARFAEKFELSMPVLLDGGGSTAGRYRVRALPTSFLIDAEGLIRDVKLGQMNREYIESQLTLLGALAVPELTTPVPAAWATDAGSAQQLDMQEIFPPGEGRDLVVETCLICHDVLTFGFARKTRQGWLNNEARHTQEFFARLSAPARPGDAEVETMYDYLVANFDSDRPLSKQLPPGFVCGV